MPASVVMKDRWAVILGVSSGSGRDIARALAADPAMNIFGIHRGNYPEQAEELRREIEDLGQRAVFVQLDAGTWEGTLQASEQLAQVAGPRNTGILVHAIANASLGCFLPGGQGPFRQLIPQNFHKTMDSMANTFAWWAQRLHDLDLLAPGARLLGLTNPISDSLIHNFALITAAKAALEVYVRHLAWELGPLGYRVNLLNYGTVDTPAVRAAFTPDRWERFQRVVARAIPAGRLLTTREVGRFVSRLLDEEALWVNGATIDFTGGQSQGLLDALIYDAWQHEPAAPEDGNPDTGGVGGSQRR